MAILRFKRANEARWQELNPLLLSGEPGYEKDTGRLKIGDGILNWNDLPYLSGEGGSPIVLENVDDRVNELLVAGNGIDLNYNDEEDTLTITNTKPIVAPQWTVNHTLADGTRYLAGDVVWDNGNIFVAKYDNESLPTSNTTYWQNLGSGNRLNIDGRDIPNIPSAPQAVSSVNGMTGDVQIASSFSSKIVQPSGTLENPIDHVAIQNAISDLYESGGGRLFLKSGEYYLGNTIDISMANIEIIGEGRSTVLNCVGDYGDVFHCALETPPPSFPGLAGLVFSDFRLETTVARTSGAAIYAEYTHDFLAKNLYICDISYGMTYDEGSLEPEGTIIPNAFFDGIKLAFQDQAIVSNVTASCSNSAVWMNGSNYNSADFSYNGLVKDCDFYGVGVGKAIHFGDGLGGSVIDNVSINNWEYGAYVVYDGGNQGAGIITIKGGYAENCSEVGYYIRGFQNVVVHSLWGNLDVDGDGTSLQIMGALQNHSITAGSNVTISAIGAGAGACNIIGGNIIYSELSGKNNSRSGPLAAIGGGWNNTAGAGSTVVSGGRSNTAGGDYDTVGGGYNNTSSSYGGAIGGGVGNSINGDCSGSTIGGGRYNTSSARYTTIAGGFDNASSGKTSTIGGGFANTSSSYYSTVGGGKFNTSSGYSSTIAGGYNNTSSGNKSTVGGGAGNTSSNYSSTVGGGRNNTSSGYYCAVGGGTGNTSSGNSSTVSGGYNNTSSSACSTVGGGVNNTSSGNSSTVGGGFGNTSSGYYSTVGGGRSNTSGGYYSAIVGGNRNTNSGYNSSIVGGYWNVISGSYNFIGSGHTLSVNGNFSAVIAGRSNHVVSSNRSIICGGTDNSITNSHYSSVGGGNQNSCASNPKSVIAGGEHNTISGGEYGRGATIGGGGFNTAAGILVTLGGGGYNYVGGSASTVAGGRYNGASGTENTIAGGYSNNIASDWGSIGGGYQNYLGGSAAVIGGGYNNTIQTNFGTISGGLGNWIQSAAEYGIICGGNGNVLNSLKSFIGGGQSNLLVGASSNSTIVGGYANVITNGSTDSVIAGGSYNLVQGAPFSCIVGGKNAKAYLYGMRAYSSGNFTTLEGNENPLKQHINVILSNKTSNNTPKKLYLDGESQSYSFDILPDSAIFATVTICGIGIDGINTAHYVRKVAIKRVDENVSLIGSVSTIGTDFESNAGYDVSITANNINKTLDITVTGSASDTMRWVAVVDGIQTGLARSGY